MRSVFGSVSGSRQVGEACGAAGARRGRLQSFAGVLYRVLQASAPRVVHEHGIAFAPAHVVTCPGGRAASPSNSGISRHAARLSSLRMDFESACDHAHRRWIRCACLLPPVACRRGRPGVSSFMSAAGRALQQARCLAVSCLPPSWDERRCASARWNCADCGKSERVLLVARSLSRRAGGCLLRSTAARLQDGDRLSTRAIGYRAIDRHPPVDRELHSRERALDIGQYAASSRGS
jgi:hypothetical protein